MTDEQPQRPSSWRQSSFAPVAIVVAAMVVVAVVQIALSFGPSDPVCAITATQGQRATSPTGAFDRWFTATGPAELHALAKDRPSPTAGDVVRVAEREWRWDVFGETYVLVKLSRRTAQDSYWVSELLLCD